MGGGRIQFPIDQAVADQYRRDGFWNGDTLKEWLARSAAAYPNRTAIKSLNSLLTYEELQERVHRLASGLASLGIGKGDVIAVQLQNVPEFIVVYLAAGFCGAVVQTVHMPYRGSELAQLLGHSHAKVLVVHDRIKDYEASNMGVGLKKLLPKLEHVISVGANAPQGTIAFDELGLRHVSSLDYSPSSSDPYVLLYTSGTSGSPKGVPSIYETYLGNARATAPILGLHGESVVLSAAPFTHLYGIFTLNVSLCVGATIALIPAFNPDSFGAEMAALSPTCLFCGPAHLSLSQHAGMLSPDFYGDLDFVMVSGAACPPELARRTQAALRHGKVLQLWGMSEVQCGCITRMDDPEDVRFHTVGAVAPGAEIRIAVDGQVMREPDVEGELQIRGASIFVGYLDNPDASRSAYTADGWFRTGDTARIDALGNVTMTGRSKDIINRGGVKINPTDIEAAITDHPNVLACAIVPMPDLKLGERACLFAIQKGSEPLELHHITTLLNAKGFAKLLWPERLELVSELPLTPTKKVVKSVLADAIRRKVAAETNPITAS